jgi:hypothetical protein
MQLHESQIELLEQLLEDLATPIAKYNAEQLRLLRIAKQTTTSLNVMLNASRRVSEAMDPIHQLIMNYANRADGPAKVDVPGYEQDGARAEAAR